LTQRTAGKFPNHSALLGWIGTAWRFVYDLGRALTFPVRPFAETRYACPVAKHDFVSKKR